MKRILISTLAVCLIGGVGYSYRFLKGKVSTLSSYERIENVSMAGSKNQISFASLSHKMVGSNNQIKKIGEEVYIGKYLNADEPIYETNNLSEVQIGNFISVNSDISQSNFSGDVINIGSSLDVDNPMFESDGNVEINIGEPISVIEYEMMHHSEKVINIGENIVPEQLSTYID